MAASSARSPSAFAGLALALGLLAAAPAAAAPIALKMAANVPVNSPWDLGLKRLAADFDRASGGQVKLTFPQSVRVASESDIIQKMRLGIDGALLTTIGLAELYPDSLALSLPSLVRSDAEFDAVLEAMTPLVRKSIGDRYELLAFSRGGWIRTFSRQPIVYPEDLARMRVSVDPVDEKVTRLLQSLGARTVKGDLGAFLLQLNSNAVDSILVSPVYVASLWSQVRGKLAYMSSFRVSPFIGAVVFNKSSWAKIPADIRPKLEAVLLENAARISADSAKLEEDAIAAMRRDGLALPQAPADAPKRWDAMITSRRDGLIAEMFSDEILGAIDAALAKARAAR
ncbi:MAG TPA: TRAP transporter substrate-binding protein DctP [Spirochaetales bacterium]|nr:TRAP transporter substrate-binding protein DctP [Spirochaetales bacterium]HRY55649.1 TRAP transporter substrate-binding protein DctP [Spirochaetia bacterium]HRZ63531.1 TRAP transporter substrate-binding protein DctP [Spirochaetia bacterium]